MITPVRKVLIQDAKISVEMQEKLQSLIHTSEDNMSSLLNENGYTKLIEMNMEPDPNLPPIASKPIHSLLNIKSGLEKR